MSSKPVIQLATKDDAAQILEIYSPFIYTPVTFEEEVPSLAEFEERISKIQKDCPYLVCKIANQVVGYAYSSEFRSRASYRWSHEVSVYIHPEFRGMNIGRALYTALFKILKLQHIATLLAVITVPNDASVKLHESMGFKPCATLHNVGYKHKKWHDVGIWERSIQEDEHSAPEEPIAFSTIRESAVVSEILQKSATLIHI